MTESKPATTIFLDLIIGSLASMFLSATNGDVAYARAAATEAVNAYQTQNLTDPLAVSQIIAFGLAALGSLSLATASDLSIPMILRLRGNAISSSRAGEQIRRMAAQQHQQPTTPLEFGPEDNFPDEAAVIAGVEDVRKQLAEATAQPAPQPQPAPPPLRTAPALNNPPNIWAGPMADVAAEITASLPNLPPAERRAASIRAAALSSVVRDMLQESETPPALNFRYANQSRKT